MFIICHIVIIITIVATLGLSFCQFINIPPNHATHHVGEQGSFECVTDLGADQLMRWEFNGNVIYSYEDGIETLKGDKEKYHVEQNGKTFILQVKQLQFCDGGIYSCIVTNEHHDANLIVLDQPVLRKVPVNDSETEIYTCEGHFGGPPQGTILPNHFPKLQILLDGYPLANDKDVVEEIQPIEGTKEYVLTKSVYMGQRQGTRLRCEITTDNPRKSFVVHEDIYMKETTVEESIADDENKNDEGIITNSNNNSGWKIAVPVVVCLTFVISGVLGAFYYKVKGKKAKSPQPDKNDEESNDSTQGTGNGEHQTTVEEDNKENGEGTESAPLIKPAMEVNPKLHDEDIQTKVKPDLPEKPKSDGNACFSGEDSEEDPLIKPAMEVDPKKQDEDNQTKVKPDLPEKPKPDENEWSNVSKVSDQKDDSADESESSSALAVPEKRGQSLVSRRVEMFESNKPWL